jgi:hypothetical protein
MGLPWSQNPEAPSFSPGLLPCQIACAAGISRAHVGRLLDPRRCCFVIDSMSLLCGRRLAARRPCRGFRRLVRRPGRSLPSLGPASASGPQVQASVPLPHPERLAQHPDRPGPTSPPEEGHAPLGQRQPLRRHHEAAGAFCSRRPRRCCAGVRPPAADACAASRPPPASAPAPDPGRPAAGNTAGTAAPGASR